METTKKIVELLETGRIPWQKGWDGKIGAQLVGLPINGKTNRPYTRLNKMFLQRRARFVVVVVEKQQPFGQIAIVQPFFAQQMRHNLLIPTSLFQVANTALRVGLAAFAKLFPKCEQLCIVKKLFLKRVCGLVVGRIEKREEVFEHPTSRSRRRNKLHNLAAFGLITLPFGQKRVAFCCRWSHNSIAY